MNSYFDAMNNLQIAIEEYQRRNPIQFALMTLLMQELHKEGDSLTVSDLKDELILELIRLHYIRKQDVLRLYPYFEYFL